MTKQESDRKLDGYRNRIGTTCEIDNVEWRITGMVTYYGGEEGEEERDFDKYEPRVHMVKVNDRHSMKDDSLSNFLMKANFL